MNSIRRALLLWLLLSIVVAGVLGAVVIYRNTLAEADVFFDNQLRQAALVLRDQAFEMAVPPQIVAEANQYDFVVQVWSANGVLAYQSQPHSSLPDLTALGFATVNAADGKWRTYGVQSRGYVIQVAQLMRVRRAQAVQLALRTLVPFLFVVPVLMAVVLIVVPRTLRPLNRLASELQARSSTDLQAIPIEPLPDEIRPMIASFNDLLERLSATYRREQAFIADAAHELRTPLTALRLQVDGLQAAHGTEERTEAERQLAAGVARAGRLVEQLLSLARANPQQQTKFEPVRMDELVCDVVAEKSVLADSHRIDLGVTQADSIAMSGDALALRALLGNLIDNAIRYSPDGSRVDVSLTRTDSVAVLRVVDNGPGIPESERERVFERFYRSSGRSSGRSFGETADGSGLGLAIVKSVATRHGASVHLDSAPGGRGLVVTVEFPLQGVNAAS